MHVLLPGSCHNFLEKSVRCWWSWQFCVRFFGMKEVTHYYITVTYSANKPWNKSLNFCFPPKHVIPKSLKVGHWLSKVKLSDLQNLGIKLGHGLNHLENYGFSKKDISCSKGLTFRIPCWNFRGVSPNVGTSEVSKQAKLPWALKTYMFRVFMVNNIVFMWPKPLSFHGFGDSWYMNMFQETAA